MRAKPDTTAFSPEEQRKKEEAKLRFIEGGAADVAERSAGQKGEAGAAAATPPEADPLPQQAPSTQVVTVQKLFRMRKDTSEALKQLALDLQKSTGRRVTETEIVEELVRTRCRLPPISK